MFSISIQRLPKLNTLDLSLVPPNFSLLHTSRNALEDMFYVKQIVIGEIRDATLNDIDNGEVWEELFELLKA